MFGHLGLMLIGTGDMLVAGHYSRESLAAIGLAIAVFNPIMITSLGLLFALSPLLAQKRGQGEDITHLFWTSLFYGACIGVVGTVLVLMSNWLIPWFGYSPNLTQLIQEYLTISSVSLFFICLFQALKEFFQAQEKTTAANLISLISAGLNVLFCFAFVFGKYGMPELHEAGLAWAANLVRGLMALALFLLASQCWKSSRTLDKNFLREAFKLGGPISIAVFFEVMAFCSVTLFVGKFDEVQIAANNIALNIASLAFMVPLSIASAVGVKVGHSYGEKNVNNINAFAQMSLLSSFCFTCLMAAIFYWLPTPILTFYTTDLLVVEWGKRLLLLVCFFQLFDGAQVTLGGILRGMGVTRATSVAIFVGYWLFGIPFGYYLGFYRGFEAEGFWIGLAISLALVAIMLGVILQKKMKALISQGL